MRVAIGQLSQESNTFNPLSTTMADYEAFGIFEGKDLLERFSETNELGGFIQGLHAWPDPPEIGGLMRLAAWPSGPLTPATFTTLIDRMMNALQRQGKVDAVLMSLHGALVAECEPDVEGHLLQLMREYLGTKVPLIATLDLHANITKRMVEAANVLVLFHTAPHIDVVQTGKRGAAALGKMVLQGASPVTAFRKLPMVMPVERANTQDPTSVSYPLRKSLEGWERNSFVLSAGLATVQPWLDIPELGSAALVVCDGASKRSWAEQSCSSLAQEVWERRGDFMPELIDIDQAVRFAHENHEGLTVISDSADATTSGSTGDSTAVLSELIRYDWSRPALITLVAPEIVAEAEQRGIGTRWNVTLGATRNPRDFRPLTLPVLVENLFDARFLLSGHLAEKLPIDMGRSAVLGHGHVHVIVTSRTGPHFAPHLFQAAGFDPFTASVLIAKSPCGFRAAYADRAKQIFVVRSPGCAPSDFWNYTYSKITRPLWPWDNDVTLGHL